MLGRALAKVEVFPPAFGNGGGTRAAGGLATPGSASATEGLVEEKQLRGWGRGA